MRKCILTYLFLASFFMLNAQNEILTDSNLPIFIINTEGGEPIPNEPKISAHLGVIENGQFQRNHIDDAFNAYDGSIGIEIRGNGTSALPKTSYLFETRNLDGSNSNVQLLGMPKENDWILYAPYIDKSLVRNVLTYELAQQMGLLASRTRYCEVVLNGEYMGLYVLMEKIKRDKNRVNVTEFAEGDGSSENGGYIFRIDAHWQEERGWLSKNYLLNGQDRAVRYQFVYPKHDEISADQKAYIQEVVTEFEDDLYDAPIYSSETYLKHIDIQSFVNYILLNEFGKNPDAYKLSTYLHFDPTEEMPRIKIGPVWDHNHCYGSYATYQNYWTKWEYDNDWWNYPGQIPFWWERFMNDFLFYRTFANTYRDYRKDLLSCETLEQRIDELSAHIMEAQERNFMKWPILGVNEPFDWNSGPSYEDELDYLKNWICNRLEWMDKEIDRTERRFSRDYVKVSPNPNNGTFKLDFKLDLPGTYNFTIHSLAGQLVLEQPFEGIQGDNNLALQLENLSSGLYIARLQLYDKILTAKVLID